MKKFLKKIINNVSTVKLFWHYERSDYTPYPFFKKLKYYTMGFFSRSMVLYDLKKKNYKEYLSDWNRLKKLKAINGDKKIILDNKIIFHEYFRNNFNIIRPIAYIYNKRIIDFETHKIISADDFLKNCPPEIILKPATEGGGKGIVVIKKEESHIIIESLQKMIESKVDYVIQHVKKQNGFPHSVYPDSLNTIRVLTMQDPETGEPFIARAVQRFGTLNSKYVDNFTSGGVCVDINIKDGVYGRGGVKSQRNEVQWLSSHPDTGIRFEGVGVNNWNSICDAVLQLTKGLFFLKYIGWDVIPIENEFLILEANSNSDINLLQMHRGLLTDDRIKYFYKKNKIIK